MRVLVAIRYKNSDREVLPMQPAINKESMINTAQKTVRSILTHGFAVPGGRTVPADRIQAVLAMVPRDPQAA